MWQRSARLEACIPRLKATVTARSYATFDFTNFNERYFTAIYKIAATCSIFFFSSTRLSCVQNLVRRLQFLLYIYMNILRIVSCDLFFDTSIVPLSIKAFSNQLIKPWIFNQLSPSVLYFAFFLLPSQDFITVLDPSLSR